MNASAKRSNDKSGHREVNNDGKDPVYDVPDGIVIKEKQWMAHAELHIKKGHRHRGEESSKEAKGASGQRFGKSPGNPWISPRLAVDVRKNGDGQ